jgi:hypothetical protein
MRKSPKFSDKRNSTTRHRLKIPFLSITKIHGSMMKAVWLPSGPSLRVVWGMSAQIAGINAASCLQQTE